jgi:predicted restriction endonuclease
MSDDNLDTVRELIQALANRTDAVTITKIERRCEDYPEDHLVVHLPGDEWWEIFLHQYDEDRAFFVQLGDKVAHGTRWDPPVYDIVEDRAYDKAGEMVVDLFADRVRRQLELIVQDFRMHPEDLELALAGDPEFESNEYKTALQRAKERHRDG